jgi:hypothetical protein
MRPRVSEPVAEQDREDAARRADQARDDAAYRALSDEKHAAMLGTLSSWEWEGRACEPLDEWTSPEPELAPDARPTRGDT